ncbi:MAG: MFS transporter [Silicimonas sp.]|nr:MFS transporter [Silicimonas sp.]
MEKRTTTKAALAIMGVFFLQPFAIGGWLALIPQVKADLGLSKAELSIALMGLPVALLIALQIAGRVVGKFGPRRTIKVFFPLQGAVTVLPLLATGVPSLFAALFVLGCMMAFLEVGMNVYAGRLEKQKDVMIMNRCHAFWAVGLMAGSALVTFAPGLVPLEMLAGLAIVSAVFGLLAGYLLPGLEREHTTVTLPRRQIGELPKTLVFVALFMLVVTLTEGVMADWSAVYLAEKLNDPYGNAGIAVTVFSGFLAGGRFLGDWLKRRIGAVALARVTVCSAVLGLVVLVLPSPVWLALPGFALMGFGVSAAYPLGVSAAASLGDDHEAQNIAIASTVALGGFLIGPPLIGFVSEASSLPMAFACLVPGLVLGLGLTRWLGAGTESDSASSATQIAAGRRNLPLD